MSMGRKWWVSARLRQRRPTHKQEKPSNTGVIPKMFIKQGEKMKKMVLALMFLIAVFASNLWAEEMKTYYPNGKIQMEISDQGMKNYYENGQLMSQIDTKGGEPFGVGKSYYEDGTLMREDNYDKKEWKQYGPASN